MAVFVHMKDGIVGGGRLPQRQDLAQPPQRQRGHNRQRGHRGPHPLAPVQALKQPVAAKPGQQYERPDHHHGQRRGAGVFHPDLPGHGRIYGRAVVAHITAIVPVRYHLLIARLGEGKQQALPQDVFLQPRVERLFTDGKGACDHISLSHARHVCQRGAAHRLAASAFQGNGHDFLTKRRAAHPKGFEQLTGDIAAAFHRAGGNPRILFKKAEILRRLGAAAHDCHAAILEPSVQRLLLPLRERAHIKAVHRQHVKKAQAFLIRREGGGVQGHDGPVFLPQQGISRSCDAEAGKIRLVSPKRTHDQRGWVNRSAGFYFPLHHGFTIHHPADGIAFLHLGQHHGQACLQRAARCDGERKLVAVVFLFVAVHIDRNHAGHIRIAVGDADMDRQRAHVGDHAVIADIRLQRHSRAGCGGHQQHRGAQHQRAKFQKGFPYHLRSSLPRHGAF